MTNPVRLQLSRRKGFNLQAWSREVNGLEAVKVSRPSIFGNPFSVLPDHEPGTNFGTKVVFGDLAFGTIAVPTVEDAVACFREMMTVAGGRTDAMRAGFDKIRGKNLACFCRLDAPCHADVLLEIVNGVAQKGKWR